MKRFNENKSNYFEKIMELLKNSIENATVKLYDLEIIYIF